jgi:lactate/malate dehydrogenase, NAD binding domain
VYSATDIRYGTPLSPKVDIRGGDYDALAGAGVVLITSGVNEKTGGATDRNDPPGRLRLLEKNAAIYRDIVPQIADPTGKLDLPDHPMARLYAISSHQHGVGNGSAKGNCQQLGNPLNSAPIQRALWEALNL